MRGLNRVALMMGLVAMSAASVEAAVIQGPVDDNDTEVYVVNNHLVAVRVFAEDADGRLHKLGLVARGALETFDIPEEVSAQEFRIKVFPTSPAWSPGPDNYGVKTNKLNSERDHQVRVWLEADLSQSVVEIDRS